MHPRVATVLGISLLAAIVATAACGEGTSGLQVLPGNPVPTIISVDPAFAVTGGGPFNLTVIGEGFDARSVIRWNGADRSTKHVSHSPGEFELETTVLTSEIATPTTIEITVFNPPPGGGISNAVSFGVFDPDDINPSPVLNSVTPTIIHAGADASLSLHGRDFADSATVIWTPAGADSGITVTPTSITDTTLTVDIPAALIGPPGFATVEVQNPKPGGGTSFAITVPVF